MTRTLTVLLVLVALAACHGQGSGAPSPSGHWSPAGLTGCYEILDATRQPAEGAWYNVMAVVRLTEHPMLAADSEPVPHSWHLRPLSNARNGRWRADPNGNLETQSRHVPRWSLNPAGDSASFDFRDGFSGASIVFAASDADRDTLRGRVTEHRDVGPPFSKDAGRAYAVRRSCP